ncbi:hypothetical protein [Streptomyces sp. NPDC048845]|uniref:hypothetical protein n=1 Tax=Streptomyces sp. NPDC048845 TaxID=3155390 RepID=UPI003429D019
METALSTFLDIVALVSLLALFLLPALVGAVRDHRVDRQLRDAEQGRDRRTGVLVTYDLAYGPHRDRVRRAGTRRTRRPAPPARGPRAA